MGLCSDGIRDNLSNGRRLRLRFLAGVGENVVVEVESRPHVLSITHQMRDAMRFQILSSAGTPILTDWMWITLFSILASGALSSIVATWVTLFITGRRDIRKAKLTLFQDLLGTRNILTPGPYDTEASRIFVTALNQISVLFHEAKGVTASLNALHESITDPNGSEVIRTKRLIELLRAMASDLRINTEPQGEGYLRRPFSIAALASTQPLNLDIRGLTVQNGVPVIMGKQTFEGGREITFHLPVSQARDYGAMLMELAAVARENDSVLRANGHFDFFAVPNLMERIARRGKMNG
jgi:hypothetical protein